MSWGIEVVAGPVYPSWSWPPCRAKRIQQQCHSPGAVAAKDIQRLCLTRLRRGGAGTRASLAHVVGVLALEDPPRDLERAGLRVWSVHLRLFRRRGRPLCARRGLTSTATAALDRPLFLGKRSLRLSLWVLCGRCCWRPGMGARFVRACVQGRQGWPEFGRNRARLGRTRFYFGPSRAKLPFRKSPGFGPSSAGVGRNWAEFDHSAPELDQVWSSLASNRLNLDIDHGQLQPNWARNHLPNLVRPRPDSGRLPPTWAQSWPNLGQRA